MESVHENQKNRCLYYFLLRLFHHFLALTCCWMACKISEDWKLLRASKQNFTINYITHDFRCPSRHFFKMLGSAKHHLSIEISFESYPHLPVGVLFEPVFLAESPKNWLNQPALTNRSFAFWPSLLGNRWATCQTAPPWTARAMPSIILRPLDLILMHQAWPTFEVLLPAVSMLMLVGFVFLFSQAVPKYVHPTKVVSLGWSHEMSVVTVVIMTMVIWFYSQIFHQMIPCVNCCFGEIVHWMIAWFLKWMKLLSTTLFFFESIVPTISVFRTEFVFTINLAKILHHQPKNMKQTVPDGWNCQNIKTPSPFLLSHQKSTYWHQQFLWMGNGPCKGHDIYSL